MIIDFIFQKFYQISNEKYFIQIRRTHSSGYMQSTVFVLIRKTHFRVHFGYNVCFEMLKQTDLPQITDTPTTKKTLMVRACGKNEYK